VPIWCRHPGHLRCRHLATPPPVDDVASSDIVVQQREQPLLTGPGCQWRVPLARPVEVAVAVAVAVPVAVPGAVLLAQRHVLAA
jgi:hypothetical protein